MINMQFDMPARLNQSFFNRHTVDVAQDLIGKILVVNGIHSIITETESYRGKDDPASHAFNATARSQIMFGSPGFTYVYMIYGMHFCLNFITEKAGLPGAVLIRGARLTNSPYDNLNGPGKLCRYFNITKALHNIDVTMNDNIYVCDSDIKYEIQSTPRIGITKGQDKLWRFIAT